MAFVLKKIRFRAVCLAIGSAVVTGATVGGLEMAAGYVQGRIDQAFDNQAAAQEMGPMLPTLIETRVGSLESRMDSLEGVKMQKPKKVAEVRGINSFHQGWIDRILGRPYKAGSTEAWTEGWDMADETSEAGQMGAWAVLRDIELGRIVVDSLEVPK